VRLLDGVKLYIEWKRAAGYEFDSSKRVLVNFSRRVGEIDMPQVNSYQVLSFLNRTEVAASTWRLRYWILYRFLKYWSDRGVMHKLDLPAPRPAVRQTFVPFIFTQQDIRSLLDVVTQRLNPKGRTDKQTLRTLLLFLYGTGVSIGEAVLIQGSDVEAAEGFVKIRSTRANRSRHIPIGSDLQGILKEYMAWRSIAMHRSPYLFVTKRDRKICVNTFAKSFGRIRRQAGVYRLDGNSYQPRVDDLRYTFAVHHIARWIEKGLDLNRMLPALAAYMGQSGLGSTERYLSLTPERFRKDLNKLSPSNGRGDWHRDKDLMKFLAGL